NIENSQNNHLMLIFYSSRRRHTILPRDWSSDVFSSDLIDSTALAALAAAARQPPHTVTVAFDALRGGDDDEAPLAARFARERGLDRKSVVEGKRVVLR